MKVQDILGSPVGLWLGMIIGRTVPPRLGYGLSRRIARWMRRNRYDMFRVLRENISHVVPEADDKALDDMAEEAVYHTGCGYFDMFHYRPEDLVARGVLEYDPAEWEMAAHMFSDPRGTVVVGPHLSNFDLMAQWFVAQGFELHALSLATPDRGDRMMNTLRRDRGILVTPISVHSLRDAMRRLRQGGTVITGVDRPADYNEDKTLFFDAPAPVPRGHIRLAMQTGARVLVVYCTRHPEGHYRLRFLPPMDMDRTGDRAHDIELNTRRVLVLIEEAIRAAPEQWIMLAPAWRRPDSLP
jgi:phosphatidylinositol dimannoside acyltransferase